MPDIEQRHKNLPKIGKKCPMRMVFEDFPFTENGDQRMEWRVGLMLKALFHLPVLLTIINGFNHPVNGNAVMLKEIVQGEPKRDRSELAMLHSRPDTDV